jgi:predicted transcriptional regulator
MGQEENLRATTTKGALEAVFERCDGVTYVVNPWADMLQTIAEIGRSFDGEFPTLRVFAAEEPLRTARKDFTLGSKLADLSDAGDATFRTGDVPETTLIVDEDQLFNPVIVGDAIGATRDTDESFVTDTYETLTDQWEAADVFDLRTPGRDSVRETMTAEFGKTPQEDFDTVVSSIEGGRSSRELDEVVVSLLVAAKNELLLYDISKWGENVGLASKATFSRRKNDLEEMGIVDTEKAPTDVGRPRQRLKLTDERLQQADSDQLAVVAQNILH